MRESNVVPMMLGIITVILIGFVFYLLQGILKPFLVAIFLTVLFEPVMNFLRSIRVPKGIAVLIVLCMAFAVLFLLGLMVYASVTSLSDEFPKYEIKFINVFKNSLQLLHIPLEEFNRFLKEIDWTEAIQKLSLPSFLSRSIGSFFSFLGNVFLVLLFMVYSLLGKEYLALRIERAFESDRSRKITSTVTNIDQQIQRYLITKTLISLATGLLATTILLLFGVDFAIVWGLITFLLNFIPNIGSIIATIPPILVAMLQFGFNWKPILVATSLILLQTTMGNIVEPKVMGKSLDLSPLVVILSLIFWGFLWGIVGMILAVPIAATIKIVTANIEPLKPISVLMSGTPRNLD